MDQFSYIPLANSLEFMAIAEILQELEGETAVDKLFRAQGLPEKIRYQPDLFYPNAELVKFVEKSARICGLNFFGLTVGAMFKFADLGLFGKYVLGAPNLAGAISRAQQSISYYESGSSLYTEQTEGTTILCYCPANPFVIGAKHQADASALMLIDLVKQFIGEDWSPEYIELNYNTAGRKSVLEDHFQVPIFSGKKAIGIPIANELLCKTPRAATNSLLPLTIHDLHRNYRSKPPHTCAGAVLNSIMLNNIYLNSDIDTIAKQFGVSVRTLQKQLNKDGHSYRELANIAIFERANELLDDTNLTIKEISSTLGYTNRQNFIRAYKKMANVTPDHARNTPNTRTS